MRISLEHFDSPRPLELDTKLLSGRLFIVNVFMVPILFKINFCVRQSVCPLIAREVEVAMSPIFGYTCSALSLTCKWHNSMSWCRNFIICFFGAQ
jgi:hypothetical protein